MALLALAKRDRRGTSKTGGGWAVPETETPVSHPHHYHTRLSTTLVPSNTVAGSGLTVVHPISPYTQLIWM